MKITTGSLASSTNSVECAATPSVKAKVETQYLRCRGRSWQTRLRRFVNPNRFRSTELFSPEPILRQQSFLRFHESRNHQEQGYHCNYYVRSIGYILGRT